MKATVDGTVIAESNKCINVEGNEYFPPDSVKKCDISPIFRSPSRVRGVISGTSYLLLVPKRPLGI